MQYKIQTRDERQDIAIDKFIINRGIGCVEWATGVGKTTLLLKAAKRLLANDSQCSIIVGVPTKQLKKQWIEEIIKMGLPMINFQVVIYNTLVKKKWSCKLFLADELHRLGATTLSKAFQAVQYKYIFGATATLERLDGKHTIITRYCPIIDTVTIDEARANGWINEFIIYNLAVDMNLKEMMTYDDISKRYYKYFGIFNHNFELAMNCRISIDECKKYSKELNNNLDAGTIMGMAKKWQQAMQERGALYASSESKIDIATDICETFRDRKIISFAMTTEYADNLALRLNRNSYVAVTYHSKQSDEENAKALEDFKNGEDTDIISTAKALDEGTNVPTIRLALINCYSGVVRQLIQRIGRSTRKIEGDDTNSIVIILYLKNTSEEAKLRRSQRGIKSGIVWVNSIADIIKAESKKNESIFVKEEKSNSYIEDFT